jgi:hypothetical protein
MYPVYLFRRGGSARHLHHHVFPKKYSQIIGGISFWIFYRDPYSMTSIHLSMSSPHIAILVVNYQTRSHIIDLIRSYREHETYRSVHWYIADNASGDTLDDIPLLYPDLDIEIFMCPRNGGFGYGNNRLAEILGDELIFYLVNPDILWVEPILERLISTLSDPHVGVV